MNKKILGIFVMTLLITTAVVLVPGQPPLTHDVEVVIITSPEACIEPGYQDIEAIVGNLGTVQELDLTCYAEIYEFITDPEHGTRVYDDNVNDIDLDVGDTETVTFANYNFAVEGRYELTICIPLVGDGDSSNNCLTLVIFVGDDTPPETSHTLNPPHLMD